MKKPYAPKKPSKNEPPPEKTISVNYWVALNEKEEIILISENNSDLIHGKSGYPDLDKIEEQGMDLVQDEEYSYSFIDKIYKILGKDFKFGNSLDSDGYVMGFIVTVKENNPNYERELKQFDTRFERYDKARARYEKELVRFQEFQKQEKIKKLQQELAQIK